MLVMPVHEIKCKLVEILTCKGSEPKLDLVTISIFGKGEPRHSVYGLDVKLIQSC